MSDTPRMDALEMALGPRTRQYFTGVLTARVRVPEAIPAGAKEPRRFLALTTPDPLPLRWEDNPTDPRFTFWWYDDDADMAAGLEWLVMDEGHTPLRLIDLDEGSMMVLEDS